MRVPPMRFPKKSLSSSLMAGLTLALAAPAYANGTARHHASAPHSHIDLKRPAPADYAYPPEYAYGLPPRVFRCYPARALVRDQVGFVAGYVPLGTCG
jgi:hypothetical protein